MVKSLLTFILTALLFAFVACSQMKAVTSNVTRASAGYFNYQGKTYYYNGGLPGNNGYCLSPVSLDASEINLDQLGGAAFQNICYYPGQGLDSTYVIGSNAGFAPLNSNFYPDVSIYVDADSGNDTATGGYSDPFKTLARAQAQVQKDIASGGRIVVYLSGTFYLNETWQLSSKDSEPNSNFVVYTNKPYATATISGGTPISGASFAKYIGNIYRAQVKRGSKFRNLFVNGQRANMARSSYPLLNSVVDASTNIVNCSSCALPKPTTTTPVETVTISQWTSGRCPSTLDSSGNVTVDPDCWNTLMIHLADFILPGVTPHITWLQNSPLFISQPGDWALDSDAGYVYYMPRTGEDLGSANVVIPNLTQLISGEGVRNVAFVGINFAHTDWAAATSYSTLQADIVNSPQIQKIPAAVTCIDCQNILFANSTFEHLGDAALAITGLSNNNLIFSNTFTDLSASAIQIGDITTDAASDTTQATTSTFVQDNVISNTGVEYLGSTAIFQAYAAGSLIDHNVIHDVPYTGISVGWGWSTTVMPNSHDNVITSNEIYNGTQLLTDGGGIYLLSAQPGTTIASNYIHDMQPGLTSVLRFVFSNGIYLDNGSSYMTVNNNVIGTVPTNPIFQNAPNIGNVVNATVSSPTTVTSGAGPRAGTLLKR